MEEFTKRLKIAIEQSGLRQNIIANKVGISKQCLSNFKSGTSYPSIQTLKLLCIVLDISADYLLGLDETEKESNKAIHNQINNLTNNGNINFN